MKTFRKWLRGYGGPAFNPKDYLNDYKNNNYLTYNKLYDDVQLELSNISNQIWNKWKISYKDLIWFEDYIDPKKYTSGLTVQSCWKDDVESRINNFESLINYINSVEESPIDPKDLIGIDGSDASCVRKLMYFDFDTIKDDEYSFDWGPYSWFPEYGEWERCRRIALDNIDYPVNILVNGSVIDGAHRLAVAVAEREQRYSCLVGIPPAMIK